MNKTAIKNFAVWARRELIEKVSQKALQYGITENKIEDADADSINGKLLTPSEKTQRKALINKIKNDGYQQTIEEIAYTWFNRFIALRFMEVNDYLPEHIRVFTNDNNEFKPQILTEAITIDLVGLDKKKVYAFKETNDDEGLYRYLIIAQCNALNEILPGMFQKINDYTELLFPNFILREDSIIDHLINDIDKDDWNPATEDGQIEILGWLYQYYISEKHEEVVDPLHGKVIEKNDIPAATQLFTTDWVVKYIVDNSVGRYWIERNSDSKLKEKLTYYVSRRTTPEVTINETITPQDVTVFDPCMGSGHFLVYAFEILMEIYREYGYSDRDAANEILKSNLYGLDIDDRASQLAYFAVMMKARQYDQRVLTRNIEPKLYSIQESDSLTEQQIDAFINSNELKAEVSKLVISFKNAKELGSIIQLPEINYEIIKDRITEIKNDADLFLVDIADKIENLVKDSELLSKKYAIVDTNPPYMNKYSEKLKDYISVHYDDYKGDLYSVFIVENLNLCKPNGLCGYMTPNTWLFISLYEKLRKYIIDEKEFVSLIQMAKGAFFKEATVDDTSFILRNNTPQFKGLYIRLEKFTGDMEVQKSKTLECLKNNNCDYYFEVEQEKFKAIKTLQIAYWITDTLREVFKNPPLYDFTISDGQNKTGNNAKFVRFFWEINKNNIGKDRKWLFYAKGGGYRKWYGNLIDVVNWSKEARDFYKKDHVCRIIPEYLWYEKGITWGLITSSIPSFRVLPEISTFDVGGSSIFFKDYTIYNYVLGILNSKIFIEISQILNPTLNYQVKDIRSMPMVFENQELISKYVDENILIEKEDWDSFETSIDYKQHPLITKDKTIKEAFSSWEKTTNVRFTKLKNNEEEINKLLIKTYCLENDISYNVIDENISIRRAILNRDIKSFISYAVGCMFGRYSLDKEGLVFAGGVFDPTNYKTLEADKDAIIPICDDDSFNDDIVTRFVEFVSKIYGKDTLEENLRFIADALGGNGTSRDVIRNYFINGFYKDHVQTYQKRPIYWLFDSGKNNGLKCLVYMHRYTKDTIARIRTDYVHDRQGVYENRMEELNQKIKSASGSEKIKLSNQLKDTKAKAEELHKYEEKIHHLADQMIEIDLDDGVKHNYEIFKDVLAPLK